MSFHDSADDSVSQADVETDILAGTGTSQQQGNTMESDRVAKLHNRY